MLNSKQRAKLRSLASTFEPMIIIGKNIHLLYFVNRFVSKNLILKATAKVCG